MIWFRCPAARRVVVGDIEEIYDLLVWGGTFVWQLFLANFNSDQRVPFQCLQTWTTQQTPAESEGERMVVCSLVEFVWENLAVMLAFPGTTKWRLQGNSSCDQFSLCKHYSKCDGKSPWSNCSQSCVWVPRGCSPSWRCASFACSRQMLSKRAFPGYR